MISRIIRNVETDYSNRIFNTRTKLAYRALEDMLKSKGMNEVDASYLISDIIDLMNVLVRGKYKKTSIIRNRFKVLVDRLIQYSRISY